MNRIAQTEHYVSSNECRRRRTAMPRPWDPSCRPQARPACPQPRVKQSERVPRHAPTTTPDIRRPASARRDATTRMEPPHPAARRAQMQPPPEARRGPALTRDEAVVAADSGMVVLNLHAVRALGVDDVAFLDESTTHTCHFRAPRGPMGGSRPNEPSARPRSSCLPPVIPTTPMLWELTAPPLDPPIRQPRYPRPWPQLWSQLPTAATVRRRSPRPRSRSGEPTRTRLNRR